jgi:NADH pyrophosphatase NudC (nudix superfamily)
VREVLEEMGIETEFVSVLSIRQSHTALFSKSDLFFICLLRPKTTQIQMQAAEIVACEWLDRPVPIAEVLPTKSAVCLGA